LVFVTDKVVCILNENTSDLYFEMD